MKKIVNVLEKKNKKNAYVTANKVNEAGGKAWKQTTRESLMQLALTGTLGNSFYASTKDTVDYAVQVVEAANAQDLKDAIVIGRNQGFIRSFNILGLIYLSKKDPVLFREAFNEVILTGGDMGDFINMTHKIRGFGRSIKNAMSTWIKAKTNEYYALKYRKDIADAIRISRFKGDNSIYKFILHHYKPEISISKALKEYPKLKAFEKTKELINDKEYDAAMKLIEKNQLDVGSLLGVGTLPDKVWDSLAKQMPTMMFLKYLDKLDGANVFKRLGTEILEEKINVPNLKKAKVFPFRLYIAYNHVTNHDVKNHLANVLNDYVTAYDWEEFNKYSWIIAPDVSGSMTQAVMRPDDRSKPADLTPAVVAGLFSGFFYKGLKQARVLPWSTDVHPNMMGPKADSVLTHIDKIAKANGGGTFMEAPIISLIKSNIKTDVFLAITDSMEWGQGWMNYWITYKEKINPKAKAFLLRVDSYNSNPFSEELAKKYDVYQIYGWNDNALKFMEAILSLR